MDTIRVHNIGESNERRGLKCTHCGKRILQTRRERRAKTARRTCINCGYNSWELCPTSFAHIENEIAEKTMDRAKTDDLGRRIL